MSSEHQTHLHRIQALTETNHITWSEEMKALFRSKGLWWLVDGKEPHPTTASPDQTAWDIKQDRAAGELMFNIAPNQRVHIRADQDNPTKAWTALKKVFIQQKASSHFVAYDEFFSIQKCPEESLPALAAWVEKFMLRIKDLHSSSFNIATLNDKLTCMAMIHALGPEYSNFMSSLALLTDLNKDKVKAAFQTKEINWRPHLDAFPIPTTDSALSTSLSGCNCPKNVSCKFCDKLGHCQCKCYSLQQAKKYYKSNKGKDRKGEKAQAATASPTGSQGIVERARNASLHSTPSDPFSPLMLNADHDWNADSGATSHMTLHRHWLHKYTPKHVAIKLANNTIVYSAGVSSVVFNPVIDGKRGWAVKFSNVLHVPELQNNLLTVLYLTQHSLFVVHINATYMIFSHGTGPPFFITSINSHNAAFLDGTIEPVTEYVHPATTVPLDLALWHCRFAHHHFADIKHLSKHNMVTGMKLNTKSLPDPICEPCLAGKMCANPFSSSTSHFTCPLELVHSDVHQVPYPTFFGYYYWVTFIDDYSRFRFVLPICAKLDVFDTFKQFKTFAENQCEQKIKTLCDNKGGEYMSNAMLKFTTKCGIERQHTVQVCPQQNGVAEHANRVLSEQITAMLAESGLAMAFWGKALATLVHVWNQCPTAALDNATPCELWHGYKPDMSHLRVWGSTAYVHIQKDKHSALHPHYEKCVFIGYPDGYKSWKFYNMTTKRTIISEHTDFDEHTTISLPTPTLSTIQAHAPHYTVPDIEDTLEDDTLEAPGVLHPGGAPDLVGKQDSEPNTPIAVPQPLPDAPETPPPTPEPVQSPIGIGACLPWRICQWPREW